MNLLEGAPPGTGIEERSCLSLAEEQDFDDQAFADLDSSYWVITAVMLTRLGCYKR